MIEKALSKDMVAKWAALILALIMWFQVASDKNPIETRIVNFDLVMNPPADVVVVSASPPKIAVTLQGRASALSRVDSRQMKIEPDLSGVPIGDMVQVPITVDPPVSGLKVLDVNPVMATIELDSVRSKEIGVSIRPVGTPNEEFEAGKPEFLPESVSVTGPGNRVDKVAYVVGVVDIGGATSKVQSAVALSAIDAAGNDVDGVVIEPSSCDVTVPFTQRPPAKSVNVVTRTVGSPKTGYRLDGVTVTPSTVKLRGEPQVIEAINSIVARSVDVTDKDASFTATVELEVPSGLAYIQTTQVSVYVRVVEDVVERSFKRLVIPHNAPPGYTWDISPREVTVLVSGRSDILVDIGEMDIQAYIDTEGKEEGSHRLPVGVVFADHFSNKLALDEITPSSVTVTFTKR